MSSVGMTAWGKSEKRRGKTKAGAREGRRYIGEETAGPSYRLVRDADEFGMTGAGGKAKSEEGKQRLPAVKAAAT
jgi:hypothetical protein